MLQAIQSLVDSVNVYIVNGLAATGLMFLYFMFYKIFSRRRPDTGKFFLYAAWAWFVNILYLAVLDIRESEVLTGPLSVFAEFTLCTGADLLFLLAARTRVRGRFASLFSNRTLVPVFLVLLILPIVDWYFVSANMHLSTAVSILFDSFSVLTIAWCYYSFFTETPLAVSQRARNALVYSMAGYSIIQFGYIHVILPLSPVVASLLQSVFVVLGTFLKTVHIYGLTKFSEFFFADYEKKRTMFEDANLRNRMVLQLSHELKTPLLELELKTGDKAIEDAVIKATGENRLQSIPNLVERIRSLIRAFQKYQLHRADRATVKTVFNINDLCSEVFVTLKATTGLSVKVPSLYKKGATVYAHENDLFQVLTNVFKNAFEATEEESPAVVKITTEITPASRGLKRWIILRVSDNGCGIAASVKERIFEQDVSTKPGEGRGNGLWIARTLLKRNEGTIATKEQDSGIGRGACFEIKLPYHPKENLSASKGDT